VYICIMFYWLTKNNQTDQGYEWDGLEREGMEMENSERKGVKGLF
jgi:hypothetical protein